MPLHFQIAYNTLQVLNLSLILLLYSLALVVARLALAVARLALVIVRVALDVARSAFVVTRLAPFISLFRSPFGRQLTIHSLLYLLVNGLRILRSHTVLLTVVQRRFISLNLECCCPSGKFVFASPIWLWIG